MLGKVCTGSTGSLGCHAKAVLGVLGGQSVAYEVYWELGESDKGYTGSTGRTGSQVRAVLVLLGAR